MPANQPKAETYTHGYHASVIAQHSARTASESAAFLLPRLKPGMRLLDMGCGPGSITIGLAETVAPGDVVGMDIGDTLIKQARESAMQRGFQNVQFEVGSVYEPPFPDNSFDAVYMHQVLQHISKPIDAVRQARRVLKPGGPFGVREVDWGSAVFWPRSPMLDKWKEVYYEIARRNGGDAEAGRHVRSWLHAAGFTDVVMSSSTWVFPGRETTAAYGESWAQRTLHSNIGVNALEYGIASKDELAGIAEAWMEWGRHPDAFFTFTHVAGIGTK
ncbi:MAG: methyltransferase domain-containing protein [Dehalococcoidia bacterium]|nr:methyltransferase domain-containing protein [Dehalococcoidia bacterium]MSQ35408.1 methyltransferase domain-containing protein [Dehalococcoidia bacterium]